MNDEACPLYPSIIDNMSWGLRMLNDTFGPCGRPLVTWQIDPFGHSREQASLFAQMYMDGLFLGRIDYQDKSTRKDNLTMEMLWKASSNLGESSHLFTGVLPNSYSPPNGFNFDILSNDAPLMANVYKTNHLIVTMGNDFNYQDAGAWFTNLDTLIKHINAKQANGSLWNAFYSTPHCYLYGLNQANQSWSSKADDFFPYASDPHAYWTGYFSSRPAFKGYVKDAQAFLQVVKQQYVLGELSTSYISLLDVLSRLLSCPPHCLTVSVQLISSLALRNLMRKSDITPPLQSYCPHLNISSCAVSESDTDFTVTAYNPLTLPVDTYVNVPVKTTLLEVFDSEGYPVKAQILSAHPGLDKAAPYNLAFLVSLPALGYRTYFVKMINSIADPCSLSQPGRREDTYTDIVFSNQILEVTIDGYSGYMKSVKNLKQNLQADITQSFLWYQGMKGDNVGFDRRASGAYIFRPNGTQPLPLGDRANVKIYKGELVTEVHQIFSPWVTQVIRLYNNSQLLELDWVVGPIPVGDGVGKEVVTRFDSNLLNNGVFYTDLNGREVLNRIGRRPGSCETQPRLTFALLTSSIPNYLTNYCTRWSALSSRLPPAVHLLTLEPWTDGSLLLRFEHIYEATDDPDGLSRPVSFSLQDVFLNLQILQVKELTLGANQYLDKASRLRWSSEVLPYVTFAYNTAKQETTGFSPFYLVHGRDVETPLDTILTYREEANLEDYVESLVTNAEDARQLARSNILKAQEKDKSRYEKSHRPVQYRDLVWVYTPVA
ncbi:MAN2B1 [Cordylochernes scorpioides]|uniref:alpha-mannosidase n=1 Tax=Cordylochernes scorpioides TaxID=51811 RepID=A0ABY6KL04_9ARAC|nr:MAN2B1 [Cordylochernes scorpioides]